MDKNNLKACYISARAAFEAGMEPEEALQTLDDGAEIIEEAQKEINQMTEAKEEQEGRKGTNKRQVILVQSTTYVVHRRETQLVHVPRQCT